MEILIYTSQITARIRYITDYIFHDYLLLDCVLTDSADEFRNSSAIKMSYGTSPLGDELFVAQHPLLLETGLCEQNIDVFRYNELPAFFRTQTEPSSFPFDVFAASFYLITRYEEYLPHSTDKFGRYSPKNALAVKENFIEQPLVNLWAKTLLSELQRRYPAVEFPKREFDFLPTYDIDQPYAYLHRSFAVNLGGLLKSLIKSHFREAKNRLLMMIRYRKDQYDTYGFQFALQQQFGFKTCYFVLCALRKGKYERSLACDSRHVKKLMRKLGQHGKVGIHPSFASDSDALKIRKEISKFSGLVNNEIEISRQHYLMLKMPQTYRSLIANDIKADYSMGYASRPGFRASVCTPFKWFDLSVNEVTPLVVYPFAYMDGTLNYHMQLSRMDAELLIQRLINNVRAVDGLFVSLWHNSSLSNSGKWHGWRSVYKHSIEYAASLCDVKEEK
ncbi:MAG: polysaccharide deacetylase family protein [Bacteroidota bacterium]|nr:polysaccharide deacetylase family protein [Bacteroidota bacterium]